MKTEVMATFFKWGHRRNRAIITAILLIAMCASIGYQGLSLYKTLNDATPLNTEHLSKKNAEAEPLTTRDFKLLFGSNEKPDARNTPTEIPKTRLNLVLRGALASIGQSQKNASAIIQGSNQDKLYEVGDTLPGGVSLKEVHADHVVLNRNGQLETLYFPDAGKDSRALQEYKSQVPVASAEPENKRPDYTQQSDGKSLEERMQELRDKLQQANQGFQ
ncbi:MAG: type II secretion system protein N [Endozoicomonas sp.]